MQTSFLDWLQRNATRLLLVGILGVLGIVLISEGVRHLASNQAMRQLEELCARCNGNASRDLVDDNIMIQIRSGKLSKQDLCRMQELWSSVRTPLFFGDRSEVGLTIAESEVEPDAWSCLNEQVTELNLARTTLDDRTLQTITSRTPRLRQMSLVGTQITDEGLKALLQVPVELLDLRKTVVTYEGVRVLLAHPTLFNLDLDETSLTAEELDRLAAEKPLWGNMPKKSSAILPATPGTDAMPQSTAGN